MKTRPEGAELIHADGLADDRQTSMTKLIVVFF
jgi:hypothetical protein